MKYLKCKSCLESLGKANENCRLLMCQNCSAILSNPEGYVDEKYEARLLKLKKVYDRQAKARQDLAMMLFRRNSC